MLLTNIIVFVCSVRFSEYELISVGNAVASTNKPSGSSGKSWILRKCEIQCIYIWSAVCVCARTPVERPDHNTQEFIRPQHVGPSTSCVVAEPYSSTTFLSLRFLSLKEKFSSRFTIIIIFLIFKSCVRLKLHNLKLCVCVCVWVFYWDFWSQYAEVFL